MTFVFEAVVTAPDAWTNTAGSGGRDWCARNLAHLMAAAAHDGLPVQPGFDNGVLVSEIRSRFCWGDPRPPMSANTELTERERFVAEVAANDVAARFPSHVIFEVGRLLLARFPPAGQVIHAPESARWWLRVKPKIRQDWPLYVVVLVFGAGFGWLVGFSLLKP